MPRSEAYDQFPQHALFLDPARVRARVRVGDDVIAESEAGLQLHDSKYPVVIYFPRVDVLMDRLTPSAHSTHCPFKGDANYFDYSGAASSNARDVIQQIAWSYEDPFDQMIDLKGHLAFYLDRAHLEVDAI